MSDIYYTSTSATASLTCVLSAATTDSAATFIVIDSSGNPTSTSCYLLFIYRNFIRFESFVIIWSCV